jgi:hypothetical protein
LSLIKKGKKGKSKIIRKLGKMMGKHKRKGETLGKRR